MKKTIAVLLAVVFSMSAAFSQTAQWKTSRHSVFAGAGVNMFMGDLGGGSGDGKHILSFKDMDIQALRPSFTVGYKYKLTERFSLRANVLYSILDGDDANSANDSREIRNLNFKGNLWDLGGSVDFYFIKEKEIPAYANLSFWKRWAAYVFIGASGVHYNPKGEIDGSWEELRPLHTEGQTTGASYVTRNNDGEEELVEVDNDEYGKWTFSYPFGIGLKYSLKNRKWTLGFELAQRYTTTDYLDDVHSPYYFNYNNVSDYVAATGTWENTRTYTAPSSVTNAISDKHLDADGTIASEKYPTGTYGRACNDYKDSYWTFMITANYKFFRNSGTQFHHYPKYY